MIQNDWRLVACQKDIVNVPDAKLTKIDYAVSDCGVE